ncbi:MAG: hypothetical protein QM790_20485 [Nibricoccus sp.]
MTPYTSNQLRIVAACLAVAYNEDHVVVWKDKEPEDFTTDIERLQTDCAGLMANCALQPLAHDEAHGASNAAETAVESQAFLLARALRHHFKKTGDLAQLALVDLQRAALVRLQRDELLSKAILLRDVGAAAQFEKDAGKRGVTAHRVMLLTTAIETYKAIEEDSRARRSTVPAIGVEKRAAALFEHINDLDDLVVQFEEYDGGERFVTAWMAARGLEGVAHAPAIAKPRARRKRAASKVLVSAGVA